MIQVVISDLLNFMVVAAGPADTGSDTQPRAQDLDQGEGESCALCSGTGRIRNT